MPLTKRKIEKTRKKKKLIFFLTVILLMLIGGVGIFFYILFSHRPLFISPLPNNYKISLTRDKDDGVELIKDGLKKKNIEFVDVVDNSNYYEISLKDKSVVIFSKEKDIKGQIASLQFILARLTMEGKLFVSLDLRYDKPVIKLK